MGQYVQYGCGLSAPEGWTNFDVSPTLRIQKAPVIGRFFATRLNVKFPRNVRYGDIVAGLPIDRDSCDAVYCSHVLEHLSYRDFVRALRNTHTILKRGGVFRLVMPDLESLVRGYVKAREEGSKTAAIQFIRDSGMGLEERKSGVRGILVAALGNSRHQWLWDESSTVAELERTGFQNIRRCSFNDSRIEAFRVVESEERFQGAIALEATK